MRQYVIDRHESTSFRDTHLRSYLGGGSSGAQTGGTVVSQVSPGAAMQAGQMQAQAAQQASQQYSYQINQAMNQLNNQYQAASASLNPTSQAGMQALDQLNQYIGLSPQSIANPGMMPAAPTLDSIASGLTRDQVMGYIRDNTNQTTFNPYEGKSDTAYNYYGNGANTTPDQPNQPYSNQALFGAGNIAFNSNGGLQNLYNNDQVQQGARQGLAQDMLPEQQTLYNQNLNTYNQQLANYNQDQGWMSQYGTPLTSQQVTDRITNLPGYQAQENAGVDAIGRSSSANGQLNSSGMLANLMNFGQNQMSTYYNNTLSQLAQIAGMGQQSTNNQANLSTSLGNNTASLLGDLGNQQGNATLAAANARANALTTANTNYNIIGQQDSGSNNGGLGSLLGSAASLASGLSGLFG